MGFGMKKENYTRRPRKAFENYKELTKEDSIRSHSRLDRDSYGIYSGNFESTSGSKFRRMIKLFFLVPLLFAVIYFLAYRPISYYFKKKNFESEFFPRLYSQNINEFEQILDFSKSLSAAHKFELKRHGSIFFVVKTPNYIYHEALPEQDHFLKLKEPWSENYQDLSIENNVLYVNRVDRKYYVLNDWAVSYEGSLSDTLSMDKILPLIFVNRKLVADCKENLERTGVREFILSEKGNLRLVLSKTTYGTYEIITSRNPPDLKSYLVSGQLAENVYWVKKGRSY